MRTILLVAVTVAALSLSTGGARADGTWCAYYVLHTNCGFYSFQQCIATLSGNGGFCQPNAGSAYGSAASAHGYAAQPPKRHRRNY